MRMSSGLLLRGPYDPDYNSKTGYPDHLYLYTGGVNSFQLRRDPAAGVAP